jgi:hypothetical protein
MRANLSEKARGAGKVKSEKKNQNLKLKNQE